MDVASDSHLKKICVLGLGYIGLPTASMFATHGFQVLGVDANQAVVEILNNGGVHIEEPGLKTLVQAALKSGRLRISAQPTESDAFVIAVPTPIHPDKTADMRYVRSAAEDIVPYLRRGNLVILESTSPPGTTKELVVPILERAGLEAGKDFMVAHSPERVLPGRILAELIQNDRVIGGIDQASAETARELYAPFVQGTIVLTDATTAEMIKLMENTYRDVNIALANEFALLAERLGVDGWEAIEIANRHPRVNILRPGPGVGGHCIAVDPWFLVEAAPQTAKLIRQARSVNDSMPAHVVELVRRALDGVKAPVVAALGATYKADVDDVRESPALEVIRGLQEHGYIVRIYEPHVHKLPGDLNDSLVQSLEAAAEGADCLLLLVNHREFASLQPASLGPMMRRRVVVDTHHCLDLETWRAAGFETILLGSGK